MKSGSCVKRLWKVIVINYVLAFYPDQLCKDGWRKRKREKESVWPTAGVKLYRRGGNRPLIHSHTLWTADNYSALSHPGLAMSCKDLYNAHAIVQKHAPSIFSGEIQLLRISI